MRVGRSRRTRAPSGESPCSAGTPRARLEAEPRAQRRAAEGVAQHPQRRSRPRTSGSCRRADREMPHLHPALGAPAHELDLLGVERSVRTTAVVPSYSLHVFVDDQVLLAEVLRHRRAGIRRRMLDVRPVDVLAGEREVRFDRLAGVAGIADDEAADDEHAVPMEHVDGARASRCRRAAAFALGVLRARLEEREVLVEDVLDAEEHVAEPGRAHAARQLVAARGDRARHALDDVVDVVQARGDDRRRTGALKRADVQRDVVVDDEDRRARRVRARRRCRR